MPLGLGLMMGLGHNVAASGGGGGGPAANVWDPANSTSGGWTFSSGNTVATFAAAGGTGVLTRGLTPFSGTDDSYDITISNDPNSFIGFVNSSCPTDGTATPVNNANFIGLWSASGTVYKGGGEVATPSEGLTAGFTYRFRRKAGKLYIAKVSGGTPTWILGDPAAGTGGYDMSAMGNVYPAYYTNNGPLTVTIA
jgi:hypothetical protein